MRNHSPAVFATNDLDPPSRHRWRGEGWRGEGWRGEGWRGEGWRGEGCRASLIDANMVRAELARLRAPRPQTRLYRAREIHSTVSPRT